MKEKGTGRVRRPAETLTDIKQLRLNSLGSLIKSTTKLTRLAVREEPDDFDSVRYRLILAYLTELRQQYALKKNIEIEKRLDALEKRS